VNVEHDAAGHRFTVREEEGNGELVYVPTPPNLFDLVHTEVDPALRGRGVGEALAEAAFAYARERGARVIPSCRFVKKWLEKNPDQRDVVDG
jgi:predicted GNAT family acetyltransferase